MENYYTIHELAKALGFSRQWVHHHIKRGNILAERAESGYVVPKDEAEYWIAKKSGYEKPDVRFFKRSEIT